LPSPTSAEGQRRGSDHPTPSRTATYDDICSMPSKDEPRWPVPVNAESSHSHEAAVLDRLRAMRRPGESYSDVIFGLVELTPSGWRASICAVFDVPEEGAQ